MESQTVSDVTAANETPATFSPVLYKFTNKAESPHLDDLLAMFYQGVLGNTVGIMEALNTITEEIEIVLVGVQLDENNNPHCYPICKLLKAEDIPAYKSPDGKGGWISSDEVVTH
jgi:hypothetical protein